MQQQLVVSCVIASLTGVAPQDITPEKTFIELGLDSLDSIELLMSLEDELSIEIPDEEVENWKTVQNVVDYVVRRADKV